MPWDDHDSDWFDGFLTGFDGGGFWATIIIIVIVLLVLYYT